MRLDCYSFQSRFKFCANRKIRCLNSDPDSSFAISLQFRGRRKGCCSLHRWHIRSNGFIRRGRAGDRGGSLTTLHTGKSHIFNSICLHLPWTIQDDRTKNHYSSSRRTKNGGGRRKRMGWKDRLGESRPREDEDEMRGTNSGTGKRGGGWHGRMADTIVGVAPTTKYYRLFLTQPTRIRGCSHPPDNRAGYVVDLAGNIYELLLPVHASFRLSLSLSPFLSFTHFDHSLLFFFPPFNGSVEQVYALLKICISALAAGQNSFSRSVFGRYIRAQLTQSSELFINGGC